jgi:hypothetical protein
MGPSVELTPEERAQILEIQDRLIDLFVDRGEAVAVGDGSRADALQGDIDGLLRELDAIKVSARGDGR